MGGCTPSKVARDEFELRYDQRTSHCKTRHKNCKVDSRTYLVAKMKMHRHHPMAHNGQ